MPLPTAAQKAQYPGHYKFDADPMVAVAIAESQWAKVSSCYELVKEEEAARGGQQYDWVIRARPDQGWILPVPVRVDP